MKKKKSDLLVFYIVIISWFQLAGYIRQFNKRVWQKSDIFCGGLWNGNMVRFTIKPALMILTLLYIFSDFFLVWNVRLLAAAHIYYHAILQWEFDLFWTKSLYSLVPAKCKNKIHLTFWTIIFIHLFIHILYYSHTYYTVVYILTNHMNFKYCT